MLKPTRDLMIFDFDGVLVNSERLMRSAYEVAVRESGAQDPATVERFLTCMGMPLPDIVRTLGLPNEFVPAYEHTCRQRIDLVTPYPDARHVLEMARRRYGFVALATGKGRVRTEELLDRFSLATLFDSVVCGDDPHPGKPDPAGVYALYRRFSVDARGTDMLGDSALDIECALRAGARAFGAGWGFSVPDVLRRAGADRVFGSASDFARWLEGVSRPAGAPGARALDTAVVQRRSGSDG